MKGVSDVGLSETMKALGDPVRREKNFIYYSLNASVLEEVLLWLQDLKGEKEP